jgi:hypothetical protein
MRSSRIHRIDRPPAVVGYSLVLGLAFVAVLMGFTAVRARDGRMPVTDWLDPLIAGVTLLAVLGALAALVVVWGHLPTRLRAAAAAVLIGAEWTYVAGEVVSNTITVGEPPADLGSLLEFAAGGAVVVCSVVIAVAVARGARRQHRAASVAVTVAATVLACGTAWWFTHPIDQSGPGTPACVPGNAVYNTLHGTAC